MKIKSENQYLSFYGHLKVKKSKKKVKTWEKKLKKKLKLKKNIPTIFIF